MRMPPFLQHGGPWQRRLRGGVFALAVAVVCLLPVVGCFGFAADITPGAVPGGESGVSERPRVLERVDESAFSAAPVSTPEDAAPALSASDAATPDASGPSDPEGAAAARVGRPVSADTIGP